MGISERFHYFDNIWVVQGTNKVNLPSKGLAFPFGKYL